MKRTYAAFITIFFATGLVSAYFLTTSTLNYIEFYKAVGKLTLQLLDVSLSIEENSVDVVLIFSITNPTGHEGLRLRELSYVLSLKAHNGKIRLYWDTISFTTQPLVIKPYWNKTFEYQIPLDTHREHITNFIELYKSQPENIVWTLDATAILISFVGIIDVPLTATLVS